MNMQFGLATMKREPLDTARFVLQVLREDVGELPDFATSKYPLPAIMQTEQQLQVLYRSLREVDAELKTIGTCSEELEALLQKAQVLRARFFKRSMRRGEGMCEAYGMYEALVEQVPTVRTLVSLPRTLVAATQAHCAV